MSGTLRDTFLLNNGVAMPVLGLGVWRARDPVTLNKAILYALDTVGYPMIDTAAQYGNEHVVGASIKASQTPRESVFITTKMLIMRGFEESLTRLQTDYVDLYLMHWPMNANKRFLYAWEAMIDIYRSGRARAIGVCNCHAHHLRDMIESTGVAPMVNQIECHVWNPCLEDRAYAQAHGIHTECYSPLMQGHIAEEPMLAELAEKYGKTPAQIALRWGVENGMTVIPKSVTPSRIAENANIFDFSLDRRDLFALRRVKTQKKFLPDSDSR